MIIATAIVRFDPDLTNEMLAEAVRVDELSLGEHGCQRSHIAKTSREGELSVVQIWDDLAAFKQHVTSSADNPDYERWRQLISEVDGTIYEGEPVPIGA